MQQPNGADLRIKWQICLRGKQSAETGMKNISGKWCTARPDVLGGWLAAAAEEHRAGGGVQAAADLTAHQQAPDDIREGRAG